MRVIVPAMRLGGDGRQVLDGPELERLKTLAEKTTATRLARAVRKACRLRWQDITHGAYRTAIELNAAIHVMDDEGLREAEAAAYKRGVAAGKAEAIDALRKVISG